MSSRGTLVLFAMAAWLGNVPGSVGGQTPDADADALARTVDALRAHATVAAGGRPYLALDVSLRSVHLMSGGVRLREYPFESAELGRPRGPGLARLAEPALGTMPWTEGSLLPRLRVERDLVVSDRVTDIDPSATTAVIPPAPHERSPAPPVFRVRFASGGFTLEVRSPGEAGRMDRARRAWWAVHDRLSAALGRGDRARIRLTMSAADAGALYRSLPDSVALVILAEPPG